ncbi:MAG: nucleotide exchange factor GrpE [Candidatus Thermoplasmatota archaeon]|nr:nucleotide exchange factor GrpE [Candidatus Thermoplasmatota archaeon]
MATSEPKKVSSYQRIKSKFAEAIKGLEAQKKLSNEYLEKLQWAQSELENLRKCFEKERENYVRTATDKLILELLPVLDGFDRIITNPVGIERKALEGLELLYKELLGVLEKAGLAPVKAVGEKFDPFMHEAVMQVIDNNWEDNTVVEELQKGYTLNSRVLRASKVKVSKRG